MSNTELFKKVWEEVKRETGRNPNSLLKDVFRNAVDKYGVNSIDGTRDVFWHAILQKEKGRERKPEPKVKEAKKESQPNENQEIFSEKELREIKKGVWKIAEQDELERRAVEGNPDISKEEFEKLHLR